jgi:hypothetical protein
MFLPDLMHDYELGKWRSLFIHLLRILDAVDCKLLMDLDQRWVAPRIYCPIQLTTSQLQGGAIFRR